jgi:hypothetical protein
MVMLEIEIFSDPLTTSVYEWVSIVIVAVQVEIFAFIVRRTPPRLPVSIVRRAL